MSPNERVITLQRQVELMQARMEKMKSQRDFIMDALTNVSLIALDNAGTFAAADINNIMHKVREQLGQDEIL